jgi:acyl carrier protein
LPSGKASESEIRDWCLAYIKQNADDPSTAVGPDLTFSEMGLDSATSAYFIVELEEWLGTELNPEIVGEYPTIAALARFIVNGNGGDNAGAG